MAFKSVKKLAAEFAVDKAINYISTEPEKNILTILNFLEKVAVIPDHKKWMEGLKNYFRNNPQALSQARRVTGNPQMLTNFINSWVIEGTLLGRPKREKIAREIGVSVPALILIDPTSACNLRCKGC